MEKRNRKYEIEQCGGIFGVRRAPWVMSSVKRRAVLSTKRRGAGGSLDSRLDLTNFNN